MCKCQLGNLGHSKTKMQASLVPSQDPRDRPSFTLVFLTSDAGRCELERPVEERNHLVQIINFQCADFFLNLHYNIAKIPFKIKV